MTKNTSIKQRRQQNRAAIIDDILAIARQMMREEGAGALNFTAIATQLGIKPPSLYTYFESKHAIYDLLFRRGFEEFGRVMQQAIDPSAPLEETVKRTVRRYMQFAVENPDLFQLMFQRPIPRFEPSEESMAVSLAVLEKSRQALGEIIRQHKLQPPLPIEQANDLMISLVHGLTALHMANHPELPVGEGRFGRLIDHAADLIIRAWTAAPTE